MDSAIKSGDVDYIEQMRDHHELMAGARDTPKTDRPHHLMRVEIYRRVLAELRGNPDVALFGLLGLVADIRAAVGDPTGKLMQDELVERCQRLYEIEKAARVWWKAKGRHNSQTATCKLGELLGEHVQWPNQNKQISLAAGQRATCPEVVNDGDALDHSPAAGDQSTNLKGQL